MRRTQVYLTDEQRKRLAILARIEQTSEAAIIRKILDRALEITDERAELLAALDAAFGSCKDYPDWPEWLAYVRGTEGGADARLKRLFGED